MSAAGSTTETLEYELVPQPPPKGALGILFMIVLADLMGFGLMIPQLPFYATHFGAGAFTVALMFSVFSLCQLLAGPVLGGISDRKGRRPVLIFSQVGSVLGYALLGAVTLVQWSPAHAWIGLSLIFLSRVIDGVSGGNISVAQAYVSDVTTRENRARGMGVLGAAFGIGFAAGPAVGGLLGEIHPSYPALAAAVFSAVAAILTTLRLPETRVHQPSGSEMFLHPSGFTPVLKKPMPRALLLIGFASMLSFVMLEPTFALFLAATKKGWGPWEVGWFFTFAGVVIAVVQGGLIGKLTKRFGEWPLTIAGPTFVAIAMLVYVLHAYHPSVWLLLLAGLGNAGGRSLAGPTMSSLLSKYTDEREQGVTFGLYHGLMSLARVIGPPIAGWAFTRHVSGPYVIASALALVVAGWTAMLWARTRGASNPVTPTPAPAA
jgi:DHA1 family tetracycline resistance protein-like MFS transporter